jgi:hypothetical protein
MVEISLSGSGEGPGWATAPGYSTAAFLAPRPITSNPSNPYGEPAAGDFKLLMSRGAGHRLACAMMGSGRGSPGERGAWDRASFRGAGGGRGRGEELGALRVVVGGGLIEVPVVIVRV